MAIDQFILFASLPALSAHFGSSTCVDGNTAIVGASGEQSAYVFARSGGIWIEQAKLEPGEVPGGRFGMAVAIHGDTAVVGAPLDSSLETNAGAVHVFVRSAGVWVKQAKLSAGDPTAFAAFGATVAVHENSVIVGAPGSINSTEEGAAYAFVRDDIVWSQEQKLIPFNGHANDQFGSAVAVQGDIAIVGARADNEAADKAGAAYVYLRSGGVWDEEQKLIAGDPKLHDEFGNAIALSGGTAIVGAIFKNDEETDAGAAYVFVRGANGWSEQQKLNAGVPVEGQRFGISVDVDGDTAAIGAILFAPSTGISVDTFAYIFERDEDDWTESEKLVTGSTMNLFGSNDFVSLSGCNVVVGTEMDDSAGTDAGAAFVYLIKQCPCTEPVEGLIGWWTLNQLASPAKDSVGNNDGDWINNPSPVPGFVNGALLFDGTQHVEVAHDPTLNLGQDPGLTIDAWVKPAKLVLLGSIVDKRDLANGQGYSLRLVDGRLSFLIGDGTSLGLSFLDTVPLPIDAWTFVAVTVDWSADVGTVYVNAEVIGSFTPSDMATGNIDNNRPLLIAKSADPADRYAGAIDELEIFNRALKATEVGQLYNSLSGGKCLPCIDPPDGLVAWWPFDEATGGPAIDFAGSNTGEYIGTPAPIEGKVDLCLTFNGIDQRVFVQDDPSLNFDSNDSFSIDAWIRPDQVDGLMSTIVEKWDSDNRVGYRLFLRSGRLVFTMNDGSTPKMSYVSPNTLPTNAWRFIVVTVDRTVDEGKVYVQGLVDGDFVPSATAPGSISHPHPLLIGGNPKGQNFVGRIDELEIYNLALPDTEISDLFIAGTSGKCKKPL